MFRQLGLFSLLLIATHGKSIYDQRQDGKFNVHAQLDNIMIVIATPAEKATSSFFNDIASQILELKGLTSRNKKVTVTDEEITEEGKDPLSIKVLKIEGDAENEHQKRLETPAIQEIKFHFNEHQLHQDEPKISEKIQSHGDEKIQIVQEEKINHEEEKIESSDKEKTPQKLISFGTISSLDGKLIYQSEKTPSENFEKKKSENDNQEKIILVKNIEEKNQESKKEEIVKLKEKRAEILSGEKSIIKVETLKKIGDQGEKAEVLPSHGKIEERVHAKSRRVARQIRVSLKDRIYSKGRTSLKKELPKIVDYKNEKDGEKNEVRHIADHKSQLKPIGDMIENCGPGRIRNRYGICQFDESFN